MSSKNTRRPSPILMLGPLALTLLGYNYMFHFPQQRELKEVNAKLTKLNDADEDVRHRFGHVLSDLANAKKTKRELETELVTAESLLAEVQRERESLLATIQTQSRPAETMDAMFEIFQRHRLLVLESTPSSSGNSSKPKVLAPILDLLAAKQTPGGAPQSRSEERPLPERASYEIHLEGSFENVRSALREIVEAMPTVLPLGVDLESVELNSPRRHWVLTLLV